MRGYLQAENPLVREILEVLDRHIERLELDWRDCQEGTEEAFAAPVDFAAGLGFVVCQKYVEETCLNLDVEKATALSIGDRHWNGLTVAAIVNAGANYWKHSSTYSEGGPDSLLTQHEATISNRRKTSGGRIRDRERLRDVFDRMGLREKMDLLGEVRIGPADYPPPTYRLFEALFVALLEPLPHRFGRIVNFLEKWRDDVHRHVLANGMSPSSGSEK